MPTPSGYQPNPIEELADYIKDWLKSLQVYVDNLSPYPEQDNTLLPLIGLPYQFDTTVGVSCSVKDGSDDYTGWEYGYGNQAVGFLQRVTLMNNSLRYGELNYIGKILSGNPGRWDLLTPAQQDDAVDKCLNVISGSLVANYTGNVKLTAYISSVGFQIDNHNDSYHIDWTDKNGSNVSGNGNPSVSFSTSVITEDADGLLQGSFSGYKTLDRYVMQDRTLIAVVNNDTQAQYIVNSRSSVNRDTLTKVCLSGATYKLYYGDNYLVYVVDNSKIYTYYDMYDGTKTAAQQINDWTPGSPVIHVPTYDENKYGPEPEPTTDDDYTDMGLGVETDGMAMYNMAVVTRDELIQLITDFEANADTGLSFIPHVLGLYKLGFESSMLVSEFTNDKIRLHKEPQKTAFNSAANYNIVKTQEVVIDCGSITVDREELLTTTFLDFSPYSTYEMFIPGCGWITLPDTIVGRTISVAIVFDLTTCSCKGVVRSEGSLLGGSGTTLATVNGIIGSSVPLSINETGLQRAAIMNGSTQAAMALGTAFMGVGIGNPYMGASGIAMAAGALASNHIAGNSTYTSTKGGATDYSVFGDGWKAVLKITRPVLEIPDNYGHSVGFVVNRYAQLNEFSGFTVCVNPHIHISATSDEKEEIKRLLEEGVILPEGE